ncbi:LysE family translocator [Kibdelosporangium persicum]|uniref:Lysine transporter LysE n=1 Tax=Kibdelosporangium persicum TaxID=2698649 RepID=A0ABX2EX59_9PSEU|nr:LysE family translocator [Kibdelosporangium persicum]NRN63625.1 Lysine transporter LysE [Kibdelosporangium persicum]
MVSALLAFAGVALLATLVPGPDTAVVIKNSVASGRRAGLLTALGCSTGQLLWGAASIAGIAAVLASSVVAFAIVKWVGVAYLCYLGIRALVAAFRGSGAPAAPQPGRATRNAYREGLLTNALNPKTALFMSALLPQFLEPGSSLLFAFTLVVTTGLVSFAFMAAYAVGFSTIGHVLRRPPVRRAIDGVMGTVLVGFGARLATE